MPPTALAPSFLQVFDFSSHYGCWMVGLTFSFSVAAGCVAGGIFMIFSGEIHY
jgi:hypothetical protein